MKDLKHVCRRFGRDLLGVDNASVSSVDENERDPAKRIVQKIGISLKN